jgi:hypothetical protein
MIKIEFTVTAADHISVMKHLTDRFNADLRPKKRVSQYFTWGLPFALLFAVPAMLFVVNHPTGTNLYIGYLIVILVVFLFAVTRLTKTQLNKFLSRELVSRNTCTVVLRSEGLEQSDSVSRSITAWEGVKDFEETPDYLIFILKLHKTVFVPASAFSTAVERKEFIEVARSYLSVSNPQVQRTDTSLGAKS